MNWHVLGLPLVWLVLILIGVTSSDEAVFMEDDL